MIPLLEGAITMAGIHYIYPELKVIIISRLKV